MFSAEQNKVRHMNGKVKCKKVCIIRSNPVRPDSRVEKEAWTLKKNGYDVHILAWDRSTNIRETNDFVNVADCKIPITRLGYTATFGEGFKNVIPYLKFQLHMHKWLKKNRFDIVHSCDFDTAFFSCGIVKRKNEKFIFDIFDFLYDRPTSFFQKCVKKAQYKIINKADATIICTEERKQQISGSKPRNLTVIHNTPSKYQITDVSVEFNCSDKVRLVYVGILQDYRLLKEIVEAVSESDSIELHIGGFGKYESFIQSMSEKFNNIYFYGLMSYSDTLALENKCDIMLAIYDPSIDNHFYAAPNKFYESLMLGKSVIMVKNTGMSGVVSQNDIGVLIDYSKESFISGVNELIDRKSQWQVMKERMKKLYREQYSWDEMERRLLELYAGLSR